MELLILALLMFAAAPLVDAQAQAFGAAQQGPAATPQTVTSRFLEKMHSYQIGKTTGAEFEEDSKAGGWSVTPNGAERKNDQFGLSVTFTLSFGVAPAAAKGPLCELAFEGDSITLDTGHFLLKSNSCGVVSFGASQPTPPATQRNQQPATQPPDQQAPDAGGPSGDNGPIALPKKPDNPDAPPPPAPARPEFKNPEGVPNMSLRVEVPEVTVDVGVLLEKTHQFVPGLKPSNFRVYEDGVEQKVEGFKRTEAPITVLLLCEYAARGYMFRVDMLNSAWAFTQQLRPQDYVAMMTFDLNTHIVSDFTQDKKQILEGINILGNEVYMPAAFRETAIFDALSESLDRLSRVEGQKYIVLIASGVDTMSKLDLDQILKKVKASHDITIFSISTGGMLLAMTEGTGGMSGGMRDMTYLQAENQMKTFSDMTGGMHFEPRFSGELPDDVKDINQNIRAKYELVYHPLNAKQDGTWRKIHVELVDDEGQPLRLQDEKHKPLKYDIIARDGYRAKQEVE